MEILLFEEPIERIPVYVNVLDDRLRTIKGTNLGYATLMSG